MKTRTTFAIVPLVLASIITRAETVMVAVASNFTSAMNEIAQRFEQKTGNNVLLSFGSSGKFYAQINHGAPFQVFLSADQAKPAALEREGHAVPGSRFTYATGALALWSSSPGLVNGSASILESGAFNKLALANPALAPYGAAAVEVLDNLGLRESTRPQWVLGENIAQAYQFVQTGNADIGFIALAQMIRKEGDTGGSAWIVPVSLYSPIRQDAVLLRAGRGSAAARELLEFLRSAPAHSIIESYGYRTFDQD